MTKGPGWLHRSGKMQGKYHLPDLPYPSESLQPYISKEQLLIHHDKHHKAYVDKANEILDNLAGARKSGAKIEIKGVIKELSFNVGGLHLHSLFWENLRGGGASPSGSIKAEIENEYGSLDRFKKEFSEGAKAVEGSGWMALAYCSETKRQLLMQIEKHNTNIYPEFKILLLLDMFEHAYYIDYKNDKARYIESFWKIIDWEEVNRRLGGAAAE